MVDKLTVTDDNELEFTDDNEVGLTDTAGCVGITIAVAKVEGVNGVLLVAAEDRVGKVVGVTVTPERLTGLFIAGVDVAVAGEAGIKVIDGEEQKFTMGWCPLLLLKSVAVTGGCCTITACWLLDPLHSCLLLLFPKVVAIFVTPAAVKMAGGGLPPAIAAGVPNGAAAIVTAG